LYFSAEYEHSSYNPYFDKPLPAWVSGYSAFTVFFYLTMDAIDGMQARKTNSSSPLGQLFDHGCDCAITTVFSIMMVNGLGIGAGWMVIAFIASVQVTFFLSQWEEKYTGVCRTNVGGLLGVTETQILLCIQMLTSAWNPHIGDTIVYDHYSYRDCYSMVYLTFMILISISCIAVNLFRHPESARELVSVVGLNFAVFAWSALMGIEKNEYWLVAVALAFCNSFSTIRVIVSSMTHTEFPIWHPFALPFFGIVLGRFIVGGGEWVRLALALYLGGLFDHIVKALIKIVNEISAYLGIYVFNITQKRG
jgi:phosphatidylglycerophosphate synthase